MFNSGVTLIKLSMSCAEAALKHYMASIMATSSSAPLRGALMEHPADLVLLDNCVDSCVSGH